MLLVLVNVCNVFFCCLFRFFGVISFILICWLFVVLLCNFGVFFLCKWKFVFVCVLVGIFSFIFLWIVGIWILFFKVVCIKFKGNL